MELERARALSVREAAAVAAVAAHYAEHGRPPSQKEIARRLGVHPSRVDRLVKAAATLGSLVVIRQKGVRTQIRLVDRLAEIATAAMRDELARRDGDHPAAAGKMVPRPHVDRTTSHARLAA